MMINGVEIGYIVVITIVLYELNGASSASFITGFPSYVVDIHRNDRCPYLYPNSRHHDRTKKNDDGSSCVSLFERDRRQEQGFRRKRQSDDLFVAGSDSSSRWNTDADLNLKPPRNVTDSAADSVDIDIDIDIDIGIGIGIDIDIDIGKNSEKQQKQKQKQQKQKQKQQKQQQQQQQQQQPQQQQSGSNSVSDISKGEASSLNKGNGEPLVKTLTMETLNGGPSLIFAMARRMLFWDDDDVDEDNDGSRPRRKRTNNNRNYAKNNNDNNDKARPKPIRIPRPKEKIVPRWHLYDGIADANPSFRMEPPAMNNRGYASTIRRNSRKRGKVSLWRHALRIYDKMKAEELEQQQLVRNKQHHPSTATILRTTEHFEAASVACAKLGLWREALGIYREIVDMGTNGGRKDLDVTDNLMLSLVGACVRAARMRRKQGFAADEQRAPLDAVRDILVRLEVEHGIPLRSSHGRFLHWIGFYSVNPIFSFLVHIFLFSTSQSIRTIINTCKPLLVK